MGRRRQNWMKSLSPSPKANTSRVSRRRQNEKRNYVQSPELFRPFTQFSKANAAKNIILLANHYPIEGL